MKPIINLNGQTAAEHIRLRREALDTLKTAFNAVAALRPHGRDYPGDRGQFDNDMAEHTSWLLSLNAIEDQILSDALDIQRSN